MSESIKAIEGIGTRYTEVLNKAGIRTTRELLKRGADRKGRQALATETGLSEDLILKWVNMADLFRIKGIASQYAELLEAAGVDTVKELRNRNSENLIEKITEVNGSKRLVRQVPAASRVADWVKQARTLAPVVSY